MSKINIKQSDLKEMITKVINESTNEKQSNIINSILSDLINLKKDLNNDENSVNKIDTLITKIKSENKNILSDNIESKKELDEKDKGQKKIKKVMGEFGKGNLKTSYGKKVTDPKQALAIGYSEAGLSKNESIEISIAKKLKSRLFEATKQTIKNRIYSRINKLGLTSHIYHDDYWQGVNAIMSAINSVDGVIESYYSTDNGGYRQNSDGVQWKEYLVTIDTEQGEIKGVLNAHASGTAEDPFSRYDVTLVLW